MLKILQACSPGDGHGILVNPFGLLYGEMTASRLVMVDIDGKVTDPGSTQLGINQPGFALHAGIHSARRDVKCVVHVHTNAGVAVSEWDDNKIRFESCTVDSLKLAVYTKQRLIIIPQISSMSCGLLPISEEALSVSITFFPQFPIYTYKSR